MRQLGFKSSNVVQWIFIRCPTGSWIFHSHSTFHCPHWWMDGLLMVPKGDVYSSPQSGWPEREIYNFKELKGKGMISNTSRSVFTLDGRVVNLEAGVLASTVGVEIDDDSRGGYGERSWMRVIAVKPQSFPVYSADLQSSNTNAYIYI